MLDICKIFEETVPDNPGILLWHLIIELGILKQHP